MVLPRALIVLFLGLFAHLLSPARCHASVVWTYDFPGTPGSGLAMDQTNPQTPNATFGDWARVNVSPVGTSDAFNSNFWNTTSNFDDTQYASFSITAAAGYHLNLQLLTFDEMRESGGPTKGRVEIFLNGSTTAYDTFDYNPTASVQNQTDNFTPTVDANNVTSVEFRFYGWDGGTATSGLILDNVTVTFDVVPESAAIWPVICLLFCVAAEATRRGSQANRLAEQ
jgi:hypothetical protein